MLSGPVKWVGGKSRTAKLIVSLLPDQCTLVEPFAGGARVFWGASRRRKLRAAWLLDACAPLMETYAAIRDTPLEVHHALVVTTSFHGKEWFMEVRRRWNCQRLTWTRARRAATFLFLNRAGFSGIFRVSRTTRRQTCTFGGGRTFPSAEDLIRFSAWKAKKLNLLLLHLL